MPSGFCRRSSGSRASPARTAMARCRARSSTPSDPGARRGPGVRTPAPAGSGAPVGAPARARAPSRQGPPESAPRDHARSRIDGTGGKARRNRGALAEHLARMPMYRPERDQQRYDEPPTRQVRTKESHRSPAAAITPRVVQAWCRAWAAGGAAASTGWEGSWAACGARTRAA